MQPDSPARLRRRCARITRHFLCFLVSILILPLPTTSSAHAAIPTGVGVMGDSLSDEYQFYPSVSAAKNYVELLAGYRGINVGSFSTITRGVPRNQGFAYNWAQSGDSSSDLLAHGQHTGLAGQFASHEADVGILLVGGNDFRGVFTAPDPIAALNTVVPALLTNVGTAAQTTLAADPNARLLIGNAPDIRYLPEVRGAVAAGLIPQALVDAVSNVIGIYNTNLSATFAGNARVGVVDINSVLTGVMTAPSFTYDTVTMNRDLPGSSPDHFFVDTIHPGTIGQGLLANAFVNAMDSRFGYTVQPFGQVELGYIAGAPFPVPEPTAAVVLVIVVGTGALRRRRRAA